MEIVFKRTDQLTEEEINGIVALFERVFEKHRDRDTHIRQFVNNPFGYSYHSLIVDNGIIVGVNTYVPTYYDVQGEKVLFANSIDSMVDKDYRDFFAYNDMVKAAYKGMKEAGVKFVYGYPNDNAYPVVIKSKLMRNIGRMRTYCLPVRVGSVKPGLKVLNPISMAFCRLWVWGASLFASQKKAVFPIHKDEDSYNATRYLRSDGKYNIEEVAPGVTLYYKIKEHEGVRTAFIIDISEKSPRAFVKAVKHIIKHHIRDFDLLLYPGWLPFGVTGMIRLPRRFEPKNFNFTGKALDKSLPDSIWQISNWDTNLSNYDLI